MSYPPKESFIILPAKSDLNNVMEHVKGKCFRNLNNAPDRWGYVKNSDFNLVHVRRGSFSKLEKAIQILRKSISISLTKVIMPQEKGSK